VFKRYFADALESGEALAVLADDGTVIGSSRFHGCEDGRCGVEIG
jgi:hypothetical protein